MKTGTNGLHGDEHRSNEAYDGMTLRDYFAIRVSIPEDGIDKSNAEALMGSAVVQWGSTPAEHIACLKWWAQVEAAWRYAYADAMLAERDKETV